MNRLLSLFLAVFLTAAGFSAASASVREAVSEDGRITASAEMTPDPAKLADRLTMTLCVTYPVQMTLEPIPLNRDEEYGSFQIESVSAESPVISGETEKAVFRIELTPFEKGTVSLLPIPLQFRSSSDKEKPTVLLIPRGELTMTSEFEPGTASLSEITHTEPVKSHKRILLALSAVFLALTSAAVTLFLLRHFKRSVSAPQLTPRDRALQRLRILKESGIARTDLHRYYIEISETVRIYIEETTGIRAQEQTTEEFLHSLEKDRRSVFSTDLKQELAAFLEIADLVKFAKFQPDLEEIEEGYRNAESFVLHPQPEEETLR